MKTPAAPTLMPGLATLDRSDASSKAEFLEKGARFVVTSLSPERLGARATKTSTVQENRTAVRRPDQRGNDARQSTPAVSASAAYKRLASSRTEADPPGSRSVSFA